MGIVSVGTILFWFLADKDSDKHKKKPHHKFHPHPKHKPRHP